MKNKLNKIFSVAAGITILVSGAALPAFAQTTLGVGVNASATVTTGAVGVTATGGLSAKAAAKLATVIANSKSRADQEITRRINALNALNTRVNAMVKLSSEERTNLSTTIAAQLNDMTTLQTQINADAAANSTSSLKIDIQSITKSYRIFALIIPQGAIEAAADRVMTVVSDLQTISGKLQVRITAAQATGANMNASVTTLADMNAKLTDANTQVNAAVTETASLQPDNGVATVMASNTAALKDARSKIMAAQQDLVAARQDAGTIVKALVALGPSVSASSTVTASGTAQ